MRIQKISGATVDGTKRLRRMGYTVASYLAGAAPDQARIDSYAGRRNQRFSRRLFGR